MKIRQAKSNSRKKAFEIQTSTRQFEFPYARATPKPTGEDPVVSVYPNGRLSAVWELPPLSFTGWSTRRITGSLWIRFCRYFTFWIVAWS